MLFIGFANGLSKQSDILIFEGRQQARDRGLLPFRDPAKEHSPRIPNLWASSTCWMRGEHQFFVTRAAIGAQASTAAAALSWRQADVEVGFANHILCRTPASLCASATIANNVLDLLAIRRSHVRKADHRRTRRLVAATE
jgi:hypothetical protein